MLRGARVLVAEDETFIALDLADTFENAGASVIGPAATVKEALRLLATEPVDSALLDFNLADGDVTPVLELLAGRGVPIVIYTGRGLPAELMWNHPDLPVIRKPLPPARIVAELAAARERAAQG
jgi:DNA-binding response OmpR family regulator